MSRLPKVVCFQGQSSLHTHISKFSLHSQKAAEQIEAVVDSFRRPLDQLCRHSASGVVHIRLSLRENLRDAKCCKYRDWISRGDDQTVKNGAKMLNSNRVLFSFPRRPAFFVDSYELKCGVERMGGHLNQVSCRIGSGEQFRIQIVASCFLPSALFTLKLFFVLPMRYQKCTSYGYDRTNRLNPTCPFGCRKDVPVTGKTSAYNTLHARNFPLNEITCPSTRYCDGDMQFCDYQVRYSFTVRFLEMRRNQQASASGVRYESSASYFINHRSPALEGRKQLSVSVVRGAKVIGKCFGRNFAHATHAINLCSKFEAGVERIQVPFVGKKNGHVSPYQKEIIS
jgi:hypothetical protein